jgi:FlaA1/EpsC-like NDP-sugar epimerase
MSDTEAVFALEGKRILIAGGAGSIGSEIARQLAEKNALYILDNNESGLFELVDEINKDHVVGRVGDIRDFKTVQDVFQDFKPQVVFNAAAYKHVPLMEYTPLEAINTNVLGHYNLVHVAKTWECVERFVFISTDKVVSGKSIMGATKRLGETLTLNSGKGFIVVRFGNVMDSRGSLLRIWQRQIDHNEPLTVTDPRMTRYMMTIPEAVNLVCEAATRGVGGETFVLNMGEKVNIKNLAFDILKKAGREDLDIKIIGTRPGETLSEELMTQEEWAAASREGKFYVIR